MDDYIKNTVLQSPLDFSFPFPPYNIQKDFMTTLYNVLENGSCGIFESPTGTGKSLSIICGALRWLYDHEVRNKNDLKMGISLLEEKLKTYDDNSNDWLITQSKQAEVSRCKTGLQLRLRSIEEYDEQIKRIKERNEETRQSRPTLLKKPKSHIIDSYDNDNDDILLEEVQEEEDNSSDTEEEPENEYECIKIYFCSRTHSQLSQFIAEVKKTVYKNDVRVVPLASRKNFCINPNVKKLKSLSLINERCLELQKNKSGKASKTDSSNQVIKKRCTEGCPFNNKAAVTKLGEEITVRVEDIEEIVSMGRENKACPYYAARSAVRLSQLIVVPYNTLLHKPTREASKIKLKNNIVIIDEAHNLIDAIGSMHSSSVTGNQLCSCYNLLTNYKEKYQKLFSASNLLCLSQLIFVIGQFVTMLGGKAGCNPTELNKKGIDTKVYTLTEFVHAAEIDNYNLYKLLNFCQKSKIAHKLQGFIQKNLNIPHNTPKLDTGLKAFLMNITTGNTKPESSLSLQNQTLPETTINPILAVSSFIESLTNHCEDGRIICCRKITVGEGSLKFILLNSAAHFQEIAKESRAVIVAGGTMQPISEFRDQLFISAGVNSSRIIHFSCGHVIPPENILPIVVCSGSTGKQLDYSYSNRGTFPMMQEIGRILDNVCNVVPAGIVCFFPSYEYEQTIFQHLKNNGIIEKLSNKKKIFREPKKSNEVDAVLEEYARAIKFDKEIPNKKPNGCLLFSIIGGKLSEGLNFSDDLGRCVIVIGLPYPNIKSPELQEKMNFLDKTAGPSSGQIHYENLCMKAVNQSIGRAVRHKADYAAVLLLDHRYSRPNIQTALPQWMKPSLITCEKFGPAFGSLTKFFKSKKEN